VNLSAIKIAFAFRQWELAYRLAAFWLIGLFATLLLLSWLFWSAGFFGAVAALPAVIILGLFWLTLAVVALRAAWRCRALPHQALALALMPLLLIAAAYTLTSPALSLGAEALTWSRFETHRGVYEEIAADARLGRFPSKPGELQTARGVTFTVDEGAPKRVAFPMPDSLLDNWSAIVHDPTGKVRAARGFTRDGGFTAPPEIRALFGGDLVACRPMSGDFYLCGFT
jgi:hypothetical protein